MQSGRQQEHLRPAPPTGVQATESDVAARALPPLVSARQGLDPSGRPGGHLLHGPGAGALPTLSRDIIQKAQSRSKAQRGGARVGAQTQRKAGRSENLKVIQLNRGAGGQRPGGLRDSTSTLGTGA